MARAEQSVTLRLPARPASAADARRATAELAEEVGAERASVELAVGEAVGNAVIHAYQRGSDEEGTVTVSARVQDGGFVVVVVDDGIGMRPDPKSRGLGFGLPLMARVCTGVEIRARDGGGTDRKSVV